MARYRIAVCDDEPSELEDIVQSVKRYDVHGDFDIENYTDGAVLLSDLQLKKNFFDLLLLDIEMPSNGFQIAQTLTQMEKHPLVIFVTKRHEYAVQGYGIAFRYLVKPLDKSLFTAAMDAVVQELDSKHFTVEYEGATLSLETSDIYYLESHGHKVLIHCKGQDLTLRMTIPEALEQLPKRCFQSAYNLSLDDEYKDVIDPYYTLVGYYNSIRELGGAVRLLQDDIPDRIQRIKKKYGMSRQRFLNHKVEITSRMPSYDIPKKLSQLETPYTDSNCLDTAIATNMIAVGMDVDRLGLMVVTGQPKQNSEYIQATSRIGRSYPGLVVTLYNPYRPRDLSHYENFTGYHAQLYRFVEGTTATPFSARARDRVLHALVISAIRLHYPEFASNDGAAAIDKLTDEQLNEVKALIMNRLNIIKPSAKADAEHEIDDFISNWKLLATQSKGLRYYVYTTKTYNRLMNTYGEVCTDLEKPTLRSMRDVESAANMFYYTED